MPDGIAAGFHRRLALGANQDSPQRLVARALRLCVMSDTEPRIRSLSQRELRNESGRVLRAVGEGQSFVLTNSGVPVGRIVPLGEPEPTLRIVRPARRRGGWAELGIARRTDARSLSEILDELREDSLCPRARSCTSTRLPSVSC